MHYLVYRITNCLNGSCYIGAHKTKNIDDGYMGSGLIIKRAIQKYGIENFNKEILYDLDNEEDMFFLEWVCINEQAPQYNLNDGGKGGWSFVNKNNLNVSLKIQHKKYKDIWGQRLHERLKNEYYKNPDICKICNQVIPYKNRKRATCSKECFKKLVAYNNSQRIVSEETKKKISQTCKNKRVSKIYRKCICGKIIKKSNKSGYCKKCLHKYVKPWNYNKPISESTREKLRKNWKNQYSNMSS